MIYHFSTNGDFDTWVLFSKPRLDQWFCRLLSARRFEYPWRAVCKAVYFLLFTDMIHQKLQRDLIRGKEFQKGKILTRRLESCTVFFQQLIKHYFALFNLEYYPSESHRTIVNMLSVWEKSDDEVSDFWGWWDWDVLCLCWQFIVCKVHSFSSSYCCCI